MLTTNQIQFYLETIAHSADLSPAAMLEPAARLLKADLLLVDIYGSVHYQPQSIPTKVFCQPKTELPILSSGQSLGKLVVCKNQLSLNEQILLEMLYGLLLSKLKSQALSSTPLNQLC